MAHEWGARRTERWAAPPPGDTAMARQFGASISVGSAGERGLFFVVGRGVSPSVAVTTLGGQIVVQLPDDLKVLAVVPVANQWALRSHRDIAQAGLVVVDPVRFSHFAEMAKLNGEAVPARGLAFPESGAGGDEQSAGQDGDRLAGEVGIGV